MKAIMVMFDSMNRHLLPSYGCEWTIMVNFERLAELTVMFDNCYVGSMPCIPARREIHTGRYNFLHRSWGPLEPFDDSMPEILKRHAVYTHLSTDHQHYWEDGGCTYHNRYNTWFFARGQEGDNWKPEVADPEIPATSKVRLPNPWRQDWINRKYIQQLDEFPQARTFADGIEFIRKNYQQDNWFLQIETFDPHEPFFTPQSFKDLYPHDYHGPHLDWPDYFIVNEPEEQIQHLRYEYAALLSMCDFHLGKILDLMDELSLWDDTMLIVNTDHGFLLSEHDFWGKNYQPLFNEIAHIPLFIWDPRFRIRAQSRSSLVQTIDLAPTLMEFFGVPIPQYVQGAPLRDTIAWDRAVREACLFGYHGCHVNVTDGRYVYMRGPVSPDNSPLYEYTLMPTHIKSSFSIDELQNIQLSAPFGFSKGCRLMKVDGLGSIGSLNPYLWGSLLFDLELDPGQNTPIVDEEIEIRMLGYLIDLMRTNEAPPDQFERLGLPRVGEIRPEHLKLSKREISSDHIGATEVVWRGKGKKMYYTLLGLLPPWIRRQVLVEVETQIRYAGKFELDEFDVQEIILRVVPMNSLSLIELMAQIVTTRG